MRSNDESSGGEGCGSNGENEAAGLDEVQPVSSALRPVQTHGGSVSSDPAGEGRGGTECKAVKPGDSPELDEPARVSLSLRPAQHQGTEEALGGDVDGSD